MSKNINLVEFDKFIEYCVFGNLDEVKASFKDEFLNYQNVLKNLRTPLMASLEGLNFDLIKYLLDKGANPNVISINPYNPRGTLINIEIYISRENFDQEYTKEPNINIIKLLLEYGANPNLIDSIGKTALDTAIEQNHYLAKDLLISLGTKSVIDIEGDTCDRSIDLELFDNFLRACYFNKFDEVKKYYREEFINWHDDYNNKSTPLMASIHSKNIEITKYLLDKGANPNIISISPIKYTALTSCFYYIYDQYLRIEFLKLLINYGADPNVKYKYSLNTLEYVFTCSITNDLIYIEDNIVYKEILKRDKSAQFLRSIGAKTSAELEEENK